MNGPTPPAGPMELLTPGRKRLVRIASRILPDWTARQAEALLLKPPRRRGRAAEVLDAWGERRRLEVAGAELCAWQIGPRDAPRVLLVHGWGGYGAQLAGFVPPLLAAGFTALLFDHLGHGASDGRAGALPEFMAGLRTVVDAFGQPAGVIAHSMGAAATLHALREDWLAVPRVVLIGAPGNLQRHLEHLSSQVGLGRGAHRSLQRRLERRYVPVSVLDRLEGLPVDRCRALLVHDRDDADVDVAQLATLQRAWPGCEVLETRGLGHHKVLRAAEVIGAAVRFVAAREA